MRLPKKLILTVDRNVDIGAEGANILSDKFGFCVLNFDFIIIKKDKTNKQVEFSNIEWDVSE